MGKKIIVNKPSPKMKMMNSVEFKWQFVLGH